ncbi:GAF domain-containing SpoIIE family protein phosphatase [Spirillospora sp. NPDC047279]|uniref:PP2C family protein-serine/threonine phosphatase n=1 Tax=Spirillospora sp. NPDC047279 TaxID=3155478 RepID=UPI0034114E81
MHADPLLELEHAIWRAQPHELISTTTDRVKAALGVTDAEVLLADYRMTALVPVRPDVEPVRIDNTPAGHSFAAQQVVDERPGNGSAADQAYLVHLPLTVHGDRLGVLTVQIPADPPSPEIRADLERVAGVLASAIKVADQHVDVFRRARRRSRLTLAAEMQWELLPGRSCTTDEFHLAGQLEPAYSVWGDNFDWSVAPDRLTLTVTNGMGSGTEAAALTHLAVSALRNARRSGADITEQASLADQTVYAQHRGAKHVATLLLDFELATGRARIVDAGSPQLYRMRGTATELVELEAQLPLGMFGDADYVAQDFQVEPGDRFVIVSDGVHGAKSPAGDLYGTLALKQTMRDTRLQDPSEAVRTFIRSYLDYHEGGEPLDDAVVVCLDWTGKTSNGAASPR